MLQNENIIYVANAWPGDNKTSAHHVAEELARHNRLLYVEASGQRAPRASKRDYKKILAKLKKAWSPPKPIQDNIYLFSPLILPLHRYPAVRKLNGLLLKIFMKRALRRLSFDDPLLWIFMPHYSALLGSVPARGIVYYVVDEYSSQPNVDAQAIKDMEADVLASADVVFAVSDKLVENKRKSNPNVYLSTHGVDVEKFSRARDPNGHLPPDIASIRRPIAGFFGLIEDWIDLDLLKYMAGKLPDVSFVMVGSVVQDVGGLDGLKNVHFLGHKPYDVLPDYLRAFDVGLLPYKLNEQVINSNPKKLREYLAGGKPVVSARVKEVERYGDLVYIADDAQGFVDAVKRALEEDNAAAAAARAAAMEEESWTAKVERISSIVSGHTRPVENRA
ncbi:MAG: glycosyltransferase [Candidatus Latescibacterota bacterium]|jgi:glycosyltransferase involved in cell wall biosynthesis